MKILNTFRKRLIAANLIMTMCVCALFSAGFIIAFELAEDTLIDTHLADDVASLMTLYRHDENLAEVPNKSFLVHVTATGDLASLPEYLRLRSNEDPDEVFIDGNEYHLATEQHNGRTYYFLFDESTFEEFEFVALCSLIVLNISVVLCAGWLSTRLATKSMQPLTRMSAQIGAVAGTDMPVNPGVELSPHDEIHVLATTINNYRTRFGELLEREREFSSDVSHELRTPLMSMQGASELLERRAGDDESLLELTGRVRRGCYQMSTLTEALLYLARDPESFKDSVEAVSVAAVISDQVAAVTEIARARGIELNIDRAGADAIIHTVPAVIDIVVGNVLRNAIKYTDQNLVTIFQRGDEIVIQDYGPGIDETALPTLFDRLNRGGVRDPDGSGIGLALVRRFCDHYGWNIDFRSELRKGTRVALGF